MTHTEDLTLDLRRMMQLVGGDFNDLAPLLDFGLEWILRLAPFDLVAVFLLNSDHLVVKAAKGPLANDRIKNHALPLSRYPTLVQVLNSCGPRLFHESDHAGEEGDPFDGVLDLPHGHACMVAPLCFGDTPQGIITFDSNQCGAYDEHTIHLVEIYARILGMAVHQAEQGRLLHRLLRQTNERERLLREEAVKEDLFSPLESFNAGVRELGFKAKQVAATPTPVLICGETGTGKEGVAAFIHSWSERRHHPLVKLNCAAIPENLLESELFGVVRGAFSGAVKDRPGRFRIANGGTLFLDEIGELPLSLQAKFLRVLQDGSFEPVGSDRPVKVDVRIIAATNINLEKAVQTGAFRSDLYYRLAVFPLTLPPLRARMEDLDALCATLLRRLGRRLGKPGLVLSQLCMPRLRAYDWPGNIRELGNVLERGAILTTDKVLTPDALDLRRGVSEPKPEQVAADQPQDPPLSLEEVQKRHILDVLKQVNGKIYGSDGAAQLLGLKPSTLQSRMKKLGLSKQVLFAEGIS